MPHPAKIWIIAALLYCRCEVYADTLPSNIVINKVLPQEGKTIGHVTGMVQDQQGYMWLATKNGLLRYDGYQMLSYRHDPSDQNTIADEDLEAIAIDRSGIIWIGTLGRGLERFDPATGKFTHYRHNGNDAGSLNSDLITSLKVDRNGVLWIGTNNGLGRYDSSTDRFTRYTSVWNDPSSLTDNEVVSIYEDRQGTLWIGTGSVYGPNRVHQSRGGLNRLDRKTGKFTRYLHDPDDPHSLINNKVRAMFESSDGTFWVGTAGDGLHTMDRSRGTFTRLTYDPNRPDKLSRPPLSTKGYDHITFITEDVSGGIWIGTAESGLTYYDPVSAKTTHFKSIGGAQEGSSAGEAPVDFNHIRSVGDAQAVFEINNPWAAFTSRDGVLWISTFFQLYKIDPLQKKIRHYLNPRDGINAFYEDDDGSLWIGYERSGLIRYDSLNRVVAQYLHDPKDPSSLSGNYVQVIKPGRSGQLWVVTDVDGVDIFDKRTERFFHYGQIQKDSASVSRGFIFDMHEGSKGKVWVGTEKGLECMHPGSDSTTRYFNNTWITSVVEDSSGNVWAGSWMGEGLYRLNPRSGKWDNFIPGINIEKTFIDMRGVLWVGGLQGLYYFDSERDQVVRFVDTFSLKQITGIRGIAEDEEQNLWVITQSRLFRINETRTIVNSYGREHGITGELMHTIYRGRSGKIYFTDVSGYYRFFPSELSGGLNPPQLIISGFNLMNTPVHPGNSGPLRESLSRATLINLKHDQNIFSFDFSALDYSNPENNRHLYKLENYDQGWNEAGSDRRAMYFNVPPGRYVFRVKVFNYYGKWTERSINVVIHPAWWSTWWFKISVVGCLILLLYGLIRWRFRMKFRLQMERSERERQLADLRQKTGELEMRALRAQMNPHFIFNSLNSINRFILENNSDQASEYLTKFSRLVRMILQHSQSALIPLESEIESLRLYLELERLRFDDHFSYEIIIAEDLDTVGLKVPPLIIQPYTENSIWHGLMHKEERGTLKVELYRDTHNLICRITDDGVGRKASMSMKSKSASRYKSMGMQLTADRIAMTQAEGATDNYVSIADLVLPDGRPGGTEVTLKIPVNYD